MSILKATPTQRKNIAILLGYLRQQLIARNDTYSHHDIATCTVGFAIKSRLFPCLNRYVVINNGWGDMVQHANRPEIHHAVVSELALSRLFGKDYLNYIIFTSRADNNPFDPYRSTPTASLRYVIKNIAKLYGMDEAASVNPQRSAIAVEADKLRAQVTQRVADLEELVKSAEVVYKHAPLTTVKHLKVSAETELLILKNLLKK